MRELKGHNARYVSAGTCLSFDAEDKDAIDAFRDRERVAVLVDVATRGQMRFIGIVRSWKRLAHGDHPVEAELVITGLEVWSTAHRAWMEATL